MAIATGSVWFQLYVFRDRALTASLVLRAEAAGCKAVVLTIDVPVPGKRERDVRNRFTLPEHLFLKNLWPAGLEKLPKGVADSGMAAYAAANFDPALTWKDVDWLAQLTRLPVVVKGILRADDALSAVNHGAAGIIVSNHGGRQVDTTPATISVLPEIVDAVAGAVEVYVDGGIRRGTDVLKAIAYGARAVMIGRPILWGLAVGGEAGSSASLRSCVRSSILPWPFRAAQASPRSPEILSVRFRIGARRGLPRSRGGGESDKAVSASGCVGSQV